MNDQLTRNQDSLKKKKGFSFFFSLLPKTNYLGISKFDQTERKLRINQREGGELSEDFAANFGEEQGSKKNVVEGCRSFDDGETPHTT